MPASQELLAVEYEPSVEWTPPAPAQRLPESASARLARGGPTVLADNEALALAAGCRADDASGMIQAFGSLTEVLAQPHADLSRHVSSAAASRINLIHDLARRALEGPLRRRPVLSSWSAVIAYLKIVLAGVPREQFRVLFLDKKNQLIADEVMGTGTVDHAPVYPREVVRRALDLKAVTLRPTDKTEGKGPDFQVMAGAAQLGVAWKKTAKNERDYVSVKLDDPSLPRAVFANLFDGEDGYDLVWSRPRPKGKSAPKGSGE